MSTTRKATRVVMTASFTVLLVVAVVLWLGTIVNSLTINASDAAGNALSHAFGVLMAIGLYTALGILLVLAGVRGEMSVWVRIAAVALIPASTAATIAAIELLSQRSEWPAQWPIVIPVAAPALLIGFALWNYLPSLRALMPASIFAPVVWISLTVLSVAPWPLLRERAHVRGAGLGELQAIRAAKRAKWSARAHEAARAEFEAIEAGAPLYSWLPFTEPGHPLRDRALAAIHRLPGRQSETEELVRSGNVNAIREVPNLGVEVTPALCSALREAITYHARQVRPDEVAPAYATSARDVEFYMPTVEWVVSRGCTLDAALAELDTTARAYGAGAERDRFLDKLGTLRAGTSPR